MYITYIDKEFDCDVFFPEIDKNKWKLIQNENHKSKVTYDFNIYNQIYYSI